MAQGRLNLEPEVQCILGCIDNEHNFLLSGGAGSGKTYSMVQLIRQVINERSLANIACITYTNAAVKEIEDRIIHPNLVVSTIHDFLWDTIKAFQKEIKLALIDLANSGDKKFVIDNEALIPEDFFDLLPTRIQYKEYSRLREGIISHDQVILVANHLFKKYLKICDVTKDKYPFIFVDEYQDTSPQVIEILLDHLKKSQKKNIIGFFGDSMQAIYDDGIGNLDHYKTELPDSVREIKKTQNRRNPSQIIDLANRLRTDGITQRPSPDKSAPNMIDGTVKPGNVHFFYSENDDLTSVKKYLVDNFGWDFENPANTKELNLTHNLIADKAGFRALMNIYDADPIIGLKTDILKKIKDNKKNGKPEIVIDSNDSFETVVDKFKLMNRSRELKKNIILRDPVNLALFNKLRNEPFGDVVKIYLNKDSLVDDKKQFEDDSTSRGSKRDNLIRHLFKIQNTVHLYINKRYNEFLKVTDYRDRLITIDDKIALKRSIEALTNVGEKTIEAVIEEAHSLGICVKDDQFIFFTQRNRYLYDRVKEIPFKDFQYLYDYLEGRTPFSTQHKTKGAEFSDVLVVLDNGNWNDYNFEYLFLEKGTQSVLDRTRKIFYVCCTRAKDNLAVFFHDPSNEIKDRAAAWFGQENVVKI